MGDWIKDNKFTASVLASFLILLIFAFSIAKPYIDNKDASILKRINANDSTYKSMLKTSIAIQDTISKDLKKLVYGR